MVIVPPIKWLRMITISTSIGDGHCGSGQGGYVPKQFYNGFSKKFLKLQVTSGIYKVVIFGCTVSIFSNHLKLLALHFKCFESGFDRNLIKKKILNMITI